jgi:hypothetical protein
MSYYSDQLDRAARIEQEERDRSIEAARRAASAPARPLPTECDNGCGELPRERSRYCSSACKEDHEGRLARAKRMGLR